MKHTLNALLAAFLLSHFSLTAQELIPVEHFAKHQQYHNVILSPDGKHLAVSITNSVGKQAVVIMRRDNFNVLSTLDWRGDEFPMNVYWLNNERIGVDVGLKVGALAQPITMGEVIAMNIDGSKKQMLFGVRKVSGNVNPTIEQMHIVDYRWDDKKHVTVLTVPASGQGKSRLHRLNVYTGKMKRITSSPTTGGYLLMDNQGVARFATGSTSENGVNLSTVYYRDSEEDDWHQLDSFNPDQGYMTPIAFAQDNTNVYVQSNLDSPVTGIYLFNTETKERTPIVTHGAVDVNDMDFGPKGTLYAAHFEPDYSHVKVVEPTHPLGRWYPAFVKAFGTAKVRITSSTLAMNELVLKVESDKDPGSFYLFNADTQKLELLMKSKPWLDTAKLGTTEAFKFTARDGLDVYGYLTLPKGKDANLPMIVLPHGGPHGPRDYWTYDDDAQFLASRGYAVLKVNFRGSGGYGRKFQAKGYREWGDAIMNDITDGAMWAVSQGIADKERMCIYGGSFGGYASLMSVVKEPELYQCALGYVGVYDLDLIYTTGDIPERESGKNYLDKVVGHDKEQIEQFSPARHVEKIKADLFIVHGEKDNRAHYDHALLLREKLDQADIPYQWLTKPKEGHGFYDEGNRQEFYEKMAAFFEKNIGN